MIGITLLNKNSLVYSSNWLNTKTTELVLKGDNIVVRNGVYCINANTIAKSPAVVSDIKEEAISTTSVKAYPNPFINHTIIRYTLPETMHTNLTVYDSRGLRLAQLVNGKMNVGIHEARLDGSNLVDGVYLYALKITEASNKRL